MESLNAQIKCEITFIKWAFGFSSCYVDQYRFVLLLRFHAPALYLLHYLFCIEISWVNKLFIMEWTVFITFFAL